jgi:hypothetical protein
VWDANGRKVANVVNGVLKNDQRLSEKSFPLSPTLWPCGVKFDMLLVTDATPLHEKRSRWSFSEIS